MKIFAVFQGTPVADVAGINWELDWSPTIKAIKANPPLTPKGMYDNHHLVNSFGSNLPFDGLYSSRMARALDIASQFSFALYLEIQTIDGLGQHSSEENGKTVYYPGYENEGPSQWLKGGLEAIQKIYNFHANFPAKGKKVLVVSHRSIIGALIGHCRGTVDDKSISEIVNDPGLTTKGFVVFETEAIGKDGAFKLNLIG